MKKNTVKTEENITKKIAIYARFSSEKQQDKSIDDQIRDCSEYAIRNNYEVIEIFHDYCVSGHTKNRNGYIDLKNKLDSFDCVIAESLDRFGRDASEINYLYKKATIADCHIETITQGKIQDALILGVHAGTAQQFSAQLAEKTLRGLKGNALKGLPTGGKCYGYKTIKHFCDKGTIISQKLAIHKEEAIIVKRIFHEYAIEKKSTTNIAKQLNDDGILGPSGKKWGPSALNGDPKKQTGILRNTRYIGITVFNKLKYFRDPDSGKRRSKQKPESEWQQTATPELAIIDQETWNKTKDRQAKNQSQFNSNQRVKNVHISSSKVICDCCGGGASLVNAERYGCSKANKTGVCKNKKTIKKSDIAEGIGTLFESIVTQNINFKLIAKAYREKLKELDSLTNDKTAIAEHKRTQSIKQLDNLKNAIKSGLQYDVVKEDMDKLSEEIEVLNKDIGLEKHLLASILSENHVRSFIKNANIESFNDELKNALRDLLSTITLDLSASNEKVNVVQITHF